MRPPQPNPSGELVTAFSRGARAFIAALFVPVIFLLAGVGLLVDWLGRRLTRAAKRIDGPTGLLVQWVDDYIAGVDADIAARQARGTIELRDAELKDGEFRAAGATVRTSDGKAHELDAGKLVLAMHPGPDVRHPGSSASIRILHDEHIHEVDDGA